jgi:hypothetical protein
VVALALEERPQLLLQKKAFCYSPKTDKVALRLFLIFHESIDPIIMVINYS